MQRIHLLLPAAAAMLTASCANMKNDDYDTPGSGFEDYGVPDGAPAEAINPTYDTPPAYEDTAAAPVAPPAPAPPRVTRHTVVRGDSLWAISRKYGVSIEAIKQANNLRSDTAVLGTTLIIPSR
jgi:LysM repeat protein